MMRIILILLLLVPPIALYAYESEGTDRIDVSCTCLTKENPSWCKLGIGDYQEHEWTEQAYTNDQIEWDESFTADFCFRKRDDLCLCDDKSLFSGSVM